MRAFQDELPRIEEQNTQVLGVSSDSVATHEEFSRKHGLGFPLISDEGGVVQKLYAPGRVTFVIDKSGVVRFVQKGMPDTSMLLQELAKLQ